MSEPFVASGTAVVVPPSQGISAAVWEFVTSLKAMKKRNGTDQAFDANKLHRSVLAAMLSAGVNDDRLAQTVSSSVVSRLAATFDGHSTPGFFDVREAVNVTLIDHNLSHAAKRYLSFRTDEARRAKRPTFGRGISVGRYYTKPGTHPYDQIEWERRDARITNEKGATVFEQLAVEVPRTWTQTATNIVVSKYFRGKVGAPDREFSVKQLVSRVAVTISNWGRNEAYFQTAEDADTFEAELTHLLANQMAAFNSPVWFNVGVSPHPQCSACFINSVQDDMRSILGLAVTEGMLFKGGSGAGSNLSKLRSRQEYMGGSNGKASGPVSFMKGLDAFAGAIKSGGKTRRAAKMVILNADHPDIMEFITCKLEEEKKAWALMDAGYDGSMDGPAYSSIYFQNANNSVRVTDDFMFAVQADADWTTHEVTTGKPSLTYKAREVLRAAAEATWLCGDPGMQYDTTVNKWHTCKNTDRINASNPCSEYMFLDDTACNLASLNLMKFRKTVGSEQVFDVDSFKKANEIIITAMEIVVGSSSYPTPAIEQNSFDYRPLGIGYANLGALLMSFGLPYDSEEGRNLAAAITALQSGHSYFQSSKMAARIGAFAGYRKNEAPCLEVMRMHREAAYQIGASGIPSEILFEARKAWDNVVSHASVHGLRNAQISVLAPTGTIGFLMDCDTTGIEPDIALVKYKWLVGGGMMKIVNQTVPEGLRRLGYSVIEIREILEHIDKADTIEGAPHIRAEHLPVFDCAFKAAQGTRTIQYMGHVRMMAAVQPFISGAISKTVNMPREATVEEIEQVYVEGWKLGLKAIAIYRDGSKRQQALTTSNEKDASKTSPQPSPLKGEGDVVVEAAKPIVAAIVTDEYKAKRRRLPDERRAITHKFSVGNHEGYITVGLYDDGTPGEIFITMAKEGSVISGLMDAFAASISVGLQYGVPLQVLVNKFVHMRFEPSGYTTNPNIRIAKSIVDYIFRWMAMKFLSVDAQRAVGINVVEDVAAEETKELEGKLFEPVAAQTAPSPQIDLFAAAPKPVTKAPSLTGTFDNHSDAPACDTCGSMMVRNAACYKCLNCGSTSGCS